MLDLTKAVINNINQVKYLKNAKRVTLKAIDDSSKRKTNCHTYKKGSIKNIDRLQNEVRINNLKVFLENYGAVRWKRLWFVSLPATLLTLSIASFIAPAKSKTVGSVKVYEENNTIYNSNFGEAKLSKEVYAIDNNTLELVDPKGEVMKFHDIGDTAALEIFNDEDYFIAKANIANNGMLSIDFTNEGVHYNSYEEDLSYQECEGKYNELYNKIIELAKGSSLTVAEREVLENLSDDEKKTVVITILRYVDKGEVDAILLKSNGDKRTWLMVLLVLSVLIDVFYLIENKDSKTDKNDENDNNDDNNDNNENDKNDENNDKQPFEYNDLYYLNGELFKGKVENPANLFFLPIKQKEAFIAAEKERILLLYDEINKNVSYEDREKLLTGYEKRLINKYVKKPARDDNASDTSEI